MKYGPVIAALLAATPAYADTASTGGIIGAVTATTGPGIYQHVCQGCHMPNGKGAVGAATIPALAGNPKLASRSYPIYIVLNGYGAMPWFNGVMTDAQIAAVVNYVRTNFGNTYTDPVHPADVAALRGPAPVVEP